MNSITVWPWKQECVYWYTLYSRSILTPHHHIHTNTYMKKNTLFTQIPVRQRCSGVWGSNCVCNCSAKTHHRGTERVSLCFKSQLSASSTKSIFNVYVQVRCDAPGFFPPPLHGPYQKTCMCAGRTRTIHVWCKIACSLSGVLFWQIRE